MAMEQTGVYEGVQCADDDKHWMESDPLVCDSILECVGSQPALTAARPDPAAATQQQQEKGELKQELEQEPNQQQQHEHPPPHKRRKCTLETKEIPSFAIPHPKSGGLSQFSNALCERIQKLGTTTYTAITNHLLQDYQRDTTHATVKKSDDKNVRRRIYDALNVLCALGVIRKDRKNLHWKGIHALKTSMKIGANEFAEDKLTNARKRLNEKKRKLAEMSKQYLSLRNLVEHNRHAPNTDSERLFLPFIIINSDSEADIQCELADDQSAAFFDYNRKFVIHDDAAVTHQLWEQSHRGIDFLTLLPRELQRALVNPSSASSFSPGTDTPSLL